MEGKVSPWILENPMTTLKMGSQSASIATSMDTWQRNAGQKRKKTSNNALNVIKKDI